MFFRQFEIIVRFIHSNYMKNFVIFYNESNIHYLNDLNVFDGNAYIIIKNIQFLLRYLQDFFQTAGFCRIQLSFLTSIQIWFLGKHSSICLLICNDYKTLRIFRFHGSLLKKFKLMNLIISLLI